MTVGLGRNPGKRYESHSRRARGGVGIRRSCLIPECAPQRFRPLPERVSAPSAPRFYPLTSTKSLYSVYPETRAYRDLTLLTIAKAFGERAGTGDYKATVVIDGLGRENSVKSTLPKD